VWSLGVLFYYIFAGRLPFVHTNAVMIGEVFVFSFFLLFLFIAFCCAFVALTLAGEERKVSRDTGCKLPCGDADNHQYDSSTTGVSPFF
jgi:hypothetical protein